MVQDVIVMDIKVGHDWQVDVVCVKPASDLFFSFQHLTGNFADDIIFGTDLENHNPFRSVLTNSSVKF